MDGKTLRRLPKDPATDTEYGYEITSANSYQLCADFARPAVNPLPDDFWGHGAGYECFEFTLVAEQRLR